MSQASFQACLGSHKALATLVAPVAVEHVALDLEKVTNLGPGAPLSHFGHGTSGRNHHFGKPLYVKFSGGCCLWFIHIVIQNDSHLTVNQYRYTAMIANGWFLAAGAKNVPQKSKGTAWSLHCEVRILGSTSEFPTIGVSKRISSNHHVFHQIIKSSRFHLLGLHSFFGSHQIMLYTRQE